MQQSDQTDLRRNDMGRLVRDIQQAFASGDRESAPLLTKQLQSEHIATLQALQLASTVSGWMLSATFASQNTFKQGVRKLLGLLRVERDGPFEMHCIDVWETHVSNCRQRQLCKIPGCMYETHDSSVAGATGVLYMAGIRSTRL